MALLLTLAALACALLPLAAPEVEAPDDARERADALQGDRDRVLAAMRDADLDLAMGKISEVDHAALRSSLEGRAIGLMAALDRSGEDGGSSQ